jgi:hypothetical protein
VRDTIRVQADAQKTGYNNVLEVVVKLRKIATHATVSLIQTIRHFAYVNKQGYSANVVIDIFRYRGMESLKFCLLIFPCLYEKSLTKHKCFTFDVFWYRLNFQQYHKYLLDLFNNHLESGRFICNFCIFSPKKR